MLINYPETQLFCDYAIDHVPAYIDRYKDVFDIMNVTGCRISEALTRSLWTFNNANTWSLQPNKESNTRVFSTNILPEPWKSRFENPDDDLHKVNYRKIQYYLTTSLGQFGLRINEKHLLAHIYRHNYAKALHYLGYTDTEIMSEMGHKAITSTQYYINSLIYANTASPSSNSSNNQYMLTSSLSQGNQDLSYSFGVGFRATVPLRILAVGAFNAGNPFVDHGSFSTGIGVCLYTENGHKLSGTEKVIRRLSNFAAGGYTYANIDAVIIPAGYYQIVAKGFNSLQKLGYGYSDTTYRPSTNTGSGAIDFFANQRIGSNTSQSVLDFPETIISQTNPLWCAGSILFQVL